MSITKQANGEECEFLLPARVDGPTANQLEVEVLAAMRGGFKRILINLAASNFLCSAGIRVILQYHRQMKAKGGSLLVSRTSPEIDEVLELTGFREQIVEKL
jgi:anti-anti-sigma factor